MTTTPLEAATAATAQQQQSFNDDDDDVQEPPKEQETTTQVQAEAFITTTDIMSHLNKALSDLSSPEEQIANKPHFELQRRLQDGSTRRATPKEQAANDCETQIQQAVKLLADLKSNRERLDWAEAQRSYGNHVYQHKEYKHAIDVYLTCLPAVAHDETFRKVKEAESLDDDDMTKDAPGVEAPTTASTTAGTSTSKEEEEDDVELNKERLLLFMKLLNNLAQSTLQLGWYKKTEHFCTLAFEHLEGEEQASALLLASTPLYQELLSKLYFRRGKARRLRGDYALSRNDLDHAMNTLPADSSKEEQQRAAVQKELQLLQKSAAEARKNRERQKKALQRVMAPPSTSKTTSTRKDDPKASSNSVRFEETTTTGGVLFPAEHQEGPLQRRPRKNYSTLRAARPQQAPEEEDDDDAHHANKLSPWQYYVAVVGKIAEKLLEWMGDEEYSPSTGDHHAKVD
jgi:hypothetical protein